VVQVLSLKNEPNFISEFRSGVDEGIHWILVGGWGVFCTRFAPYGCCCVHVSRQKILIIIIIMNCVFDWIRISGATRDTEDYSSCSGRVCSFWFLNCLFVISQVIDEENRWKVL